MLLSRFRAVLIATLYLAAAGRVQSPACAQAVLVPVAASSTILTVHGIPLLQGAEPFLAANLSMDNLHAMAPDAGELGKGWLRAVVYNLADPMPADEVARYYQTTMRGTAVPLTNATDETQKPATDDRTRLLRLLSPQRSLAIRLEDQSGLTCITVAMYQGNAEPRVVLRAIEMLRSNGDGPRVPTSLLTRERWETEHRWGAQTIDVLRQRLRATAIQDPLTEVMRRILNQASSLWWGIYGVPRPVPASEVLKACVQEARANDWQLLSVEAESSDTAIAIFRFHNNRGMALLRAGPRARQAGAPLAPAIRLYPPITEISRLEVNGPVKLQEWFRPTQTSPRSFVAPPYPAPRGSFATPVPRAPFTAQPRR